MTQVQGYDTSMKLSGYNKAVKLTARGQVLIIQKMNRFMHFDIGDITLDQGHALVIDSNCEI